MVAFKQVQTNNCCIVSFTALDISITLQFYHCTRRALTQSFEQHISTQVLYKVQ